jgi:hypothetical protein
MNKRELKTLIKEVIDEEKRFAVTIDFFVYAKDKDLAKLEAEKIIELLNRKFDNKASIQDITPIEFGEMKEEVKKWIPKDMKRGELHKRLGIPEDKDIPLALIDEKIKMLQKRAKGDKKLNVDDSKFLHQLIAAKNLKHIK